MNIRESLLLRENMYLSEYATKASETKGRSRPETECEIRTCFQRDRDRILHSKAFRRLKHKTQVFISPDGDHYRTRLTHTLEVAQIARTLAKALNLNEDLVEAIALGHDLGHTPFGHIGEDVLNGLNPKGFRHYEQSIKVVDILESGPNRTGLNLTYEVRDGIINHTGDNKASTLEGKLIKFSDRIAYINHDIDDAIRAGIICESDLPHDAISILGNSHGERINTMVFDLVDNSFDKNIVAMSDSVFEATMKLRQFMFEKVYYNNIVKKDAEKAEYIISEIYNYYKRDLSRLPETHLQIYKNSNYEPESDDEIVSDYIAGMTDKYVLYIFNELFIPKSWDMRD
ncbi:deoxyguanosinetriphosphate triphosphohydrolase [Microaceticoccus formicicus]|uniref:deoxyguanosinetriphosphate triphosphohydrolase n=1 Tax=Microaceticoccus formicicus TaxID=3118105 RepID=UPI003CD00DE5|nr:deoxyguanosinetriphosphate triphosphohydrolase [Peptoniphilaceae bacterium AMB_02]